MEINYNRILVTGDRGFIGRNLVKKLEQKGLNVLGLEKEYLSQKNWENYLTGYLNDNGVDFIFHVGALADTLENDSSHMMIKNYESTKVISRWAKNNNVPLVYSSSASCYGDGGGYPSNLYGWSKKIAEDLVGENGQISLRYFNVYGPGEQHKGRMSSVAYQMYQKNKVGDKVFLFPKKPTRDFVYVDDVVLCNIYVMENYIHLDKRWYDVGSGQSMPFEKVLEFLGINYEYLPEGDIPKGYQFFTQANYLRFPPGWDPIYTLEKGIKKYLEFLDSTWNNSES